MIRKVLIVLGLAAALFGATVDDGLKAYNSKDYESAFKIIDELAKSGDTKTQIALGVMYDNGNGVKQNKKLAKEWCGKACDGGEQLGCENYKRLNQDGF